MFRYGQLPSDNDEKDQDYDNYLSLFTNKLSADGSYPS